MSDKHPHEDGASDERLAELLAAKTRPAEVRDTYLAAHRLVRGALSDVRWSTDLVDVATGYGAHQYGYGGWGMAALMAHAKWVSLVFMRATELDDRSGLLEGTGKALRHVKLRSLEELEACRAALCDLVAQARRLNAG
ncbi:MAG: DUF1801 domain-containing protein [Trueperaceae bacterium]|nr:DUF1801 domain-containing protein [Trueperaceae bacterium]